MDTVSSLARQYVASRRRLGELSPYTAQANRYTFDALAASVGDRPIPDVTRRHIERWLGTARVDSTRRLWLSRARLFFAWCVTNRHLDRSPVTGIKGPKPKRSQPRALPAVDIGTIFSACPDTRARLMVLLAVQEGLRVGEIARIRREHLDLHTMLIDPVIGKGKKERVVPISDETAETLFQYLVELPGPMGPLIRSLNHPDRGIQPEYVSKLIRTWMQEAGVKRAPYDGRSGHALRHSCATDMADRGVDLRIIADVLGHTELATVEIYTRRRQANGPLREALAGRTYQTRSDVA